MKNNKHRVIELAQLIGTAGLTEYQMSLVNELFEIAVKENTATVQTLEISVSQNEIMSQNPTFH